MKIISKPVKTDRIEDLFKSSPIVVPKIDDLVEGKVIGHKKQVVYIDLSPFGTGIIYGQEYLNASDTIRSLKKGDVIASKVLEMENELGYISLSLREAKEEIVWRELEELMKSKTVMEMTIEDANKGGLIMSLKGIQGFLPASQLKPEHYPKIDDGDKDKIHEELLKIVGQKIPAFIIAVDNKENKLIFSEREPEGEEINKSAAKYNIGDVIEGEITGVVDFGVFVKIEEGLEGLAHISELDWGLVDNPSEKFKVGEKTQAKVITVKDGKISLSIKALKPDPWTLAKDKFKKEDIVKAVIIKFNKHGALASLEEGVSGLVHISEFKTEENMRKKLELGKTYPFQIALFEPEGHKMVLNYIEEPK